MAPQAVERGSGGARVEGESSHLDRLGEEDVDRVRKADSPMGVDL